MPRKRKSEPRVETPAVEASPPEVTSTGDSGERPGLLGQMKAAGARLARTGRRDPNDGTRPQSKPKSGAGSRPLTIEEQFRAEMKLEWERQARMLGEVATLIWHLKTRHFGQQWSDPDPDSDDPKDRRALQRMQRTVDALESSGITIEDPTGWRYPDGGEGWMKPVQITPTPGVSESVVTDTVKPIVYRDDQLIQRGEVFVASPIHDDDTPQDETIERPQDDTSEPTNGVDDEPND